MNKISKNILIGVTAIAVVLSVGLALSNKLEQRKTDKHDNIKSKQRADNLYYDSMTEKDIAWG